MAYSIPRRLVMRTIMCVAASRASGLRRQFAAQKLQRYFNANRAARGQEYPLRVISTDLRTSSIPSHPATTRQSVPSHAAHSCVAEL